MMQLEEFSISHLSLLSFSVWRDLLWRLPVADIMCLQLESTDFTAGMELES